MSILQYLQKPVPDFLARRKDMTYFIIFVFLFAVFFIIIYHPIGFHRTSDALPKLGETYYTAITVAVGFITLVVSRILLLRRLKLGGMSVGGYLIWIVGEFLIFSILLTLLAFAINGEGEVDIVRLWLRIFIDIICILSVPYILYALSMMLHESNKRVATLSALLNQRQEKEESAPSETFNFYDQGGKLVFATRRSQVLYLESMDNYSKIYYLADGKLESYVLHSSMKSVEQQYERWGLLRCHRSYMVNISNVKLLRREKGDFVIELLYGDNVIPVSKSYSERFVHRFAAAAEA